MAETKSIEQLTKENEALKKQNKELADYSDQLEKELDKPAAPVKKLTFKSKNGTFSFAYPHGINHKGSIITPEMVIGNKDLQDELIKMKSGFLVAE